jgi:phosphate transport system substrate-binding protein
MTFYFSKKTFSFLVSLGMFIMGGSLVVYCFLSFFNPATKINSQQPSSFTKTAVVDLPETLLFRIHGSNTLGEKLVPQLLVSFLEERGGKDIKITTGINHEEKKISAILNGQREYIDVQSHGSSTAFVDLFEGNADLGMSSRPIKKEERDRLMNLMGDLTLTSNENIIGLDGLAIIVDVNNSINSLTITQLANIFSGTYTNWAELGGENMPIKIYARNDQSGTWDSFKTMVLDPNKAQLVNSAQRFESSTELTQTVSTTEGAIGFVGLAYTSGVKIIAIAQDDASPFIYPNSLTVGTEDYPLSRRLFIYSSNNLTNPSALAFLKFCAEKTGQLLVEQIGFVSQNIKSRLPKNINIYPEEMQKIIARSERLSLSFRFKDNSDELDSKALRDLDRLEKFAHLNYPQQLQLFGFSDKEGNEQEDRELSLRRVKVVEKYLVDRGITPLVALGMGNSAPLAAAKSAAGKKLNPRVEVWIF